MALIMVGGQTKSIGKTTLICNIVAAFPSVQWIALKVTTHVHIPQNCELRATSEGWSLWEQVRSGPENDTARFLDAGAQRAFLLQSDPDQLQSACSASMKQLPPGPHVIVESTRAAECLHPDLFLLVIDYRRSDSKIAVREQLTQADVVICQGNPELPNEMKYWVVGKPLFEARANGLDLSLRSLLASLLEDS